MLKSEKDKSETFLALDISDEKIHNLYYFVEL